MMAPLDNGESYATLLRIRRCRMYLLFKSTLTLIYVALRIVELVTHTPLLS